MPRHWISFEDFRLIEYTQADAEFYGTELELSLSN
jgi:hypothetical protein